MSRGWIRVWVVSDVLVGVSARGVCGVRGGDCLQWVHHGQWCGYLWG